MTFVPDKAAANLVLDHLVVGAASIDQGVAYLRDLLGVEIPFGGTHPRMGTHNCLTRIGDGIFLEIIAIDPQGTAPSRPRWFDLDNPDLQRRLGERPRPIAWLAGTRDIETALARADRELGVATEMTRGDLAWLISVRDDGRQAEGVLPSLIQWPEGPHPATRMADCGIRFGATGIRHPKPRHIALRLSQMGAENLVAVEPAAEPALHFDLYRPDGKLVRLA
jgi:hypothetical protein